MGLSKSRTRTSRNSQKIQERMFSLNFSLLGHCQKMKPSWDRLASTFAKSEHVVIGDADCTSSGQQICQKVGVQGYPTIKYYVDGVQRDYKGGRDFSSLKKFVEKNLGPPPPPCEITKMEKTCS